MRVPRVRFTVRLVIAVTWLLAAMTGLALWLHREVVAQQHAIVISLDIFFSSCNLGTHPVQTRNPLNGATTATVDDPGY